MKKITPGLRQSAWLPWTIVALIAASCCILAVLQYRWITEFSTAERDRMRADLQSRLALLSRDFNDEVSTACRELLPEASQISASGREKAYAVHYQVWRKSHDPLFRRIGLVIPRGSPGATEMLYENLDFNKLEFTREDWPADLAALRTRLESRANATKPMPPPQPASDSSGPRAHMRMMFPRFGESPDGGFREQEWLFVELDDDYIRATMLPALVKKYLAEPNGLNYDTEVTLNNDSSKVVFPSGAENDIVASSDASVPLFSIQFRLPPPQRGGPGRGPGPRGRLRDFGPPDGRGQGPEDGRGRFGRRGPPPDGRGPRDAFGPPDGFGPPPDGRRGFDRGPGGRGPGGPESGKRWPPGRGPASDLSPAGAPVEFNQPHEFAQARWRLYARHRAGSLDTLTARARNRNIAISAGLLMLILTIVGSLLHISQQSQRLAESHMNFVAGVSHELRTPLTVIRTAAYNLRGKLANRPDQVEKYGKLIQEESEKLGDLVEQVLQFASGEAGHDIREREPIAVDELIDDSLRWSLETLEARGIRLEKQVDADLPPALADPVAMKHALRNLIDNALKYGTESSPTGNKQWIGVSASAIRAAHGPAIEIRVADHGPGIPAAEQAHIFDPFFRGQRAISDQIHGTGLGLNLTRRIIEAHGGTIDVESSADSGTVFIVRIPAGANTLSPIGVTT